MTELVVVQAGSGGPVLFEGDPAPLLRAAEGETGPAGIGPVGIEPAGVANKLKDAAGDIAGVIKAVRHAVFDGFAGMATDKAAGGTLKSAEVEFAIKVSAEGNVFVAKGAAEASLTVKLAWDFA